MSFGGDRTRIQARNSLQCRIGEPSASTFGLHKSSMSPFQQAFFLQQDYSGVQSEAKSKVFDRMEQYLHRNMFPPK